MSALSAPVVLALTDSQTASVSTVLVALVTALGGWLAVRQRSADRRTEDLAYDVRALWKYTQKQRDLLISAGVRPPKMPRLRSMPALSDETDEEMDEAEA